MIKLTQAWYWELTEQKPKYYALMLCFDDIQHSLKLSTDDSRNEVIEKLLQIAIEIEQTRQQSFEAHTGELQ